MLKSRPTLTTSDVIVVKGLAKKYNSHAVVSGLSFTVKTGETLGLLGPNGAGKTTTMRMLMGLSRPSSGQASVFGFDLPQEVKQVHPFIGVVFEKPNLFENLSGYQNLAIFCRLYGQPLTLIRPLLEEMDLGGRANDPVKVYSKGMRQRILILRALIHNPRLLFLDEPCSGLDPVSSRIIRDYLLKLKAEGVTILLTSHDMDEVDELCDRIGFINHGKLIVLATTRSLKARYGQPLLKITYFDQDVVKEETLIPSLENLTRLHTLYQNDQIVSVHSTEATLAEIFRKLSAAPSPDPSQP